MIVIYVAVVVITLFMLPAIIGGLFGDGIHQKFLDDYVDGMCIIVKWAGIAGVVSLIIKSFIEVFK